ncbi:FAD-binding protein [Naasia lichenicola]|uniref:FAD-binding protein n=1 Tax=Naasia lichenicola TaxID=2565933 RepID=A0A4S4FLE9_9MICO|nr:FAD-binding protein [Naasia lichenicola]THG30145.1 FAD-binding protein [Naasia lichenicola]
MTDSTSDAGSNWAGTHRYGAAALHRPTTIGEAQALVAGATRIRALGSRHSFNDLADTDGVLISLAELEDEPLIDAEASTVTVTGGTSYGELAVFLEQRGWALHNMGSLPHISIAGATATGTHGSGDRNGSLSSAVVAVERIGADGDLVRLSDRDPDFAGAVIALGAIGVVTRLTLRIQPSYQVRQDVFVDLPWSTARAELDAIMASAYSVSLFTDWRESAVQQVWVKTRIGEAEPDPGSGFFGAASAGEKVMSPADEGHDNTTTQGGLPGPWSERLPHFRLDATPSNGDEIQTEYFVDRTRAIEAVTAVHGLRELLQPHLLISELRSVAGDSQWLSPTRGAASLAIHFTWKNHPTEVRALLPTLEAALAPFDARPHWGKWFALAADDVVPKYPHLAAFRNLADRMDPTGKFRNAYLQRVLGL